MADNGYLSSYGIPNTSQYDKAQANLGYQYTQQQASSAYNRFLSEQNGLRSLTDMNKSFTRALPQQYAGFNRRGLAGPGVGSGTMQRSMQNYLGDYASDYANQQSTNASQLQQYDLADLQDQAYYQSQLDDLESAKQNEIANAALGIQALRPYFGSI